MDFNPIGMGGSVENKDKVLCACLINGCGCGPIWGPGPGPACACIIFGCGCGPGNPGNR